MSHYDTSSPNKGPVTGQIPVICWKSDLADPMWIPSSFCPDIQTNFSFSISCKILTNELFDSISLSTKLFKGEIKALFDYRQELLGRPRPANHGALREPDFIGLLIVYVANKSGFFVHLITPSFRPHSSCLLAFLVETPKQHFPSVWCSVLPHNGR